jgi:sugar phosphate isomerase/epimerase
MTYNLAKDWNVDTIINNCQKTGYNHVELRTGHAHGVEVSLTEEQRREIKQKFNRAGIALSLASAFAYHWKDPLKMRDHVEGTKEYIQLARDIGALGIRVFPNAIYVREGIPVDFTLKQIGQSLNEVAAFGNEHDVEVRLCVHGKGTDRIHRIKKIIDYSKSPYVYVNWNCTPHDLDGEGLKTNFNLVRDRIRNVHIHDLTNESYPYKELFQLLIESGYQGYCDAEVQQSCEPIRFMKYYRSLFFAMQNGS